MKRIFTFCFITITLSLPKLWAGATEAVTQLVGRNAEGYLGPVGTILGTDMNSGFYRKATPHKILGFDFTIDVVYAMAPVGNTTYDFIVPKDSIGYSFPFKFPKSLLTDDLNILSAIPTAEGSLDETLYQDQEIDFNLSVADILESPSEPAQNILGTSETSDLDISFDVAATEIFDQVIDNTWNIAEIIPGLGTDYEIEYEVAGNTLTETLPALYEDRDAFAGNFGDSIKVLIGEGLEDMDVSIPIPGGIGDKFKNLPISVGIPLPILQASFGLPFHTELTIRGLPVAVDIPSIGSVKFGGFGGKIGISEFFKKKPKKQPKLQISPKIKYILEELPSEITPADIDSALAEIRTTNMDLTELDSLNKYFHAGDSMVVYEIVDQLEKISTIPRTKKVKPKGWPVDVSLGYYTNDLILDMGKANVESTNKLLSLQAGKTFNFPFIAFLGGIGIYGGLGLESSDLTLSYTLDNPIGYGCFSGSGTTKTYLEDMEKEYCSGGSKEWTSGIPTDINLNFPGDNKFRSTIGARIRILLMDVYVDYNTGTSNAINAGIGITFR